MSLVSLLTLLFMIDRGVNGVSEHFGALLFAISRMGQCFDLTAAVILRGKNTDSLAGCQHDVT